MPYSPRDPEVFNLVTIEVLITVTTPSALVPTSFRGETSGGLVKGRPFSQAFQGVT